MSGYLLDPPPRPPRTLTDQEDVERLCNEIRLSTPDNRPDAAVLVRHWSSGVRVTLAEQKWVPLDVLALLIRDADPIVRAVAARNPSIDRALVSRGLSNEPSEGVRELLRARHERLP